MKKSSLSWNIKDYQKINMEPPGCVSDGKTEGEIMEEEDIISWYLEITRVLKVLKEEYPPKYQEQLEMLKIDLDYLYSLGKINSDQKDKMLEEGNFNFEIE